MGGVEGLAFVNTKYANVSDDFPDIEFHFVSGSTNSDGGNQLRKAHGLTERFYETVYGALGNKDVWSIIPMLSRPRYVKAFHIPHPNTDLNFLSPTEVSELSD